MKGAEGSKMAKSLCLNLESEQALNGQKAGMVGIMRIFAIHTIHTRLCTFDMVGYTHLLGVVIGSVSAFGYTHLLGSAEAGRLGGLSRDRQRR